MHIRIQPFFDITYGITFTYLCTDYIIYDHLNEIVFHFQRCVMWLSPTILLSFARTLKLQLSIPALRSILLGRSVQTQSAAKYTQVLFQLTKQCFEYKPFYIHIDVESVEYFEILRYFVPLLFKDVRYIVLICFMKLNS